MLTPGAFDSSRHNLDQRLTALSVLFMIGFATLAISFWVLQIVKHDKYREMADNNHLRSIPLRAPRGVLFDRNGAVLVDNRESYTIALVREQSRDVGEAIRRLAAAVGLEEQAVAESVERHRREPLYRPITIVDHATLQQVAAVHAHRRELPEVVIQREPSRAYPPDQFGAHLFGYVSEIQESQLERAEFAGLQQGAIVGQAGLEKTYNARLIGSDGKRDVVVDSKGREIAPFGMEDPVDGQRLQLTIDVDVQRALDEAFRVNAFAGAAVFMDPRNGEILAMTSRPAFDPNEFAAGIRRASWSALQSDPLKPLQNRLIQGKYSPGSTFKILMAVAGLSEGVITPETTFYCPGYATFYGRRFACDKKEGHGSLDLRHAIEKSCNVYFYNVGDRLTVDKIHAYAELLGLSGKTGIDLPGEVESLVPSTEWKMKTRGEKWYPGETISVAIGQGQVSVTPIALATMITTVANGGTVVTPHVVRAVDEGEGWRAIAPPPSRPPVPLRPEVIAAVHDGLWLAVNGAGTAGRARIDGKDVAGKTGTAQVISNEGRAAAAGKGVDLRDNSWFEFFAPRDNPVISGVVMAEHAGHGGVTSAPIAKYVMETYFAKLEGRPLPTWPAPPPGAAVTTTTTTAAVPPAASAGRGTGAPSPPPAQAAALPRRGGAPRR
jgi:penicillin-binding protein 2